ncbi:hypothetical protein [Flavilitoribacter nigricans]|uniref:hypothetical protein n=1 Tax=Flavilitoribacter nigricans TaxID=70997 RepID=UPI001473BA80|nr:hypothetical protein [Flavilitoribacter nigricans]
MKLILLAIMAVGALLSALMFRIGRKAKLDDSRPVWSGGKVYLAISIIAFLIFIIIDL